MADASLIISRLVARGETLAVAESLTGGLLAATIVNVAGASAAFQGGLIVYATPLKAILAGVDLYLSGEASEQTFHSARENDISFIAAGHHATERYGVQALGDYLARRFALEHIFIDCPNPI